MVSFIVLAYILNSTLLIVHEIDSAYWKEWDLFGLPGGVSSFLLIHIPIVMILLFGVIGVHQHTGFGYIISWITSFGGVFAFFIHSYFIRAGNPQFETLTSQVILYGLLISSGLQTILVYRYW
jgi:hypothetical protein